VAGSAEVGQPAGIPVRTQIVAWAAVEMINAIAAEKAVVVALAEDLVIAASPS
jgi:hypothetical protein